MNPVGDWNNYQVLVMDFYNPSPEPLALVIKVTDYQHNISGHQHSDRFNQPIVLTSGWNEVRLSIAQIRQAPATREMEMDKITGVTIFAGRLQEPREFYWDNIRLEQLQ